ncbi:Serine/threonine-protein kinase RUNKEL [Hondaea fermentalgiana]|uniref:Serine/threonine-protein kinase RUNKEL n=1 Tax=Hondaea fermentalgiana TaxID=2315210 RepID=A0A2R5GIK4_9STRA|nr:Serine/threonine-protein kinase RUNKEL [Hondaea fermentalgiana]|eukprot:GBG30722.1 Serine/threonine-protein kinase RUNKEL [Hondaea fermentalgiana]
MLGHDGPVSVVEEEAPRFDVFGKALEGINSRLRKRAQMAWDVAEEAEEGREEAKDGNAVLHHGLRNAGFQGLDEIVASAQNRESSQREELVFESLGETEKTLERAHSCVKFRDRELRERLANTSEALQWKFLLRRLEEDALCVISAHELRAPRHKGKQEALWRLCHDEVRRFDANLCVERLASITYTPKFGVPASGSTIARTPPVGRDGPRTDISRRAMVFDSEQGSLAASLAAIFGDAGIRSENPLAPPGSVTVSSSFSAEDRAELRSVFGHVAHEALNHLYVAMPLRNASDACVADNMAPIQDETFAQLQMVAVPRSAIEELVRTYLVRTTETSSIHSALDLAESDAFYSVAFPSRPGPGTGSANIEVQAARTADLLRTSQQRERKVQAELALAQMVSAAEAQVVQELEKIAQQKIGRAGPGQAERTSSTGRAHVEHRPGEEHAESVDQGSRRRGDRTLRAGTWAMDRYHIYEEIGRGQHSLVYKGREKQTVQYVAIKSVDKSKIEKVLQEVRVQHKLNHPNCLRFFKWYETRHHIWLILEFATGGSLLELLRHDGQLPESAVRVFGADLVHGLLYLHSNGVLHCDLKPSNVLLNEYGVLKLSDFALSMTLDQLSKMAHTSKRRGTPCYMAPELFTDEGVPSVASDLWSLGVVLYELVMGTPPFVSRSFAELVHLVQTSPLELPAGDELSVPFKNLLRSLLRKDPAKRITWSALLTHEFWDGMPMPAFSRIPANTAYQRYMETREYIPSCIEEDSDPDMDDANESTQSGMPEEDSLRMSTNARRNILRESLDSTNLSYVRRSIPANSPLIPVGETDAQESCAIGSFNAEEEGPNASSPKGRGPISPIPQTNKERALVGPTAHLRDLQLENTDTVLDFEYRPDTPIEGDEDEDEDQGNRSDGVGALRLQTNREDEAKEAPRATNNVSESEPPQGRPSEKLLAISAAEANDVYEQSDSQTNTPSDTRAREMTAEHADGNHSKEDTRSPQPMPKDGKLQPGKAPDAKHAGSARENKPVKEGLDDEMVEFEHLSSLRGEKAPKAEQDETRGGETSVVAVLERPRSVTHETTDSAGAKENADSTGSEGNPGSVQLATPANLLVRTAIAEPNRQSSGSPSAKVDGTVQAPAKRPSVQEAAAAVLALVLDSEEDDKGGDDSKDDSVDDASSGEEASRDDDNASADPTRSDAKMRKAEGVAVRSFGRNQNEQVGEVDQNKTRNSDQNEARGQHSNGPKDEKCKTPELQDQSNSDEDNLSEFSPKTPPGSPSPLLAPPAVSPRSSTSSLTISPSSALVSPQSKRIVLGAEGIPESAAEPSFEVDADLQRKANEAGLNRTYELLEQQRLVLVPELAEQEFRGAGEVQNLLMEPHDYVVRPIVGNPITTALPVLKYNPRMLPFPNLTAQDAARLDGPELEQFFSQVFRALSSGPDNSAMQVTQTLGYLYSLCTTPRLANVIVSSSLVALLIRLGTKPESILLGGEGAGGAGMRSPPRSPQLTGSQHASSALSSDMARLASPVGSTAAPTMAASVGPGTHGLSAVDSSYYATSAALSMSSISNSAKKPSLKSQIRKLRVRVTIVLAVLIRHATFISPRLNDEGLLEAFTSFSQEEDVLPIRRYGSAGLGELLFYITANAPPLPPPPSLPPSPSPSRGPNPVVSGSSSPWQGGEGGGMPGTSSINDQWKISGAALKQLLSCLLADDETIRFYAAKTFENVLSLAPAAEQVSQGANATSLRFATAEVASRLLHATLREKAEHLRSTCAMALAHLVRVNRRLLPRLAEHDAWGFMVSGLQAVHGSPRVQQAFLNILNLVLHSSGSSTEALHTPMPPVAMVADAAIASVTKAAGKLAPISASGRAVTASSPEAGLLQGLGREALPVLFQLSASRSLSGFVCCSADLLRALSTLIRVNLNIITEGFEEYQRHILMLAESLSQNADALRMPEVALAVGQDVLPALWAASVARRVSSDTRTWCLRLAIDVLCKSTQNTGAHNGAGERIAREQSDRDLDFYRFEDAVYGKDASHEAFHERVALLQAVDQYVLDFLANRVLPRTASLLEEEAPHEEQQVEAVVDLVFPLLRVIGDVELAGTILDKVSKSLDDGALLAILALALEHSVGILPSTMQMSTSPWAAWVSGRDGKPGSGGDHVNDNDAVLALDGSSMTDGPRGGVGVGGHDEAPGEMIGDGADNEFEQHSVPIVGELAVLLEKTRNVVSLHERMWWTFWAFLQGLNVRTKVRAHDVRASCYHAEVRWKPYSMLFRLARFVMQ